MTVSASVDDQGTPARAGGRGMAESLRGWATASDTNWRFRIFAVALVVFVGLIWVGTDGHPDHPITLGVVKGMVADGLNVGRWDLHDMPFLFDYAQYNFTGYHTTLAHIFSVLGLEVTPQRLSQVNLVFFLGALGVAAGRFGVPWRYALFAALCVTNVLLVQDSGFFRAENFVLLLLAVVLVPMSTPRLMPTARTGGASAGEWSTAQIGTLLAMSMATGLLMSTKASFGILPVLVIAGVVYAGIKQGGGVSWQRVGAWCAAFAFLTGVGLYIGNPNALLDRESLLGGIKALQMAYSTGTLPSLPDTFVTGPGSMPHGTGDSGMPLRNLLHATHVTVATTGILVFAGLWLGWRRGRPQERVVAVGFFLLWLYFSTRGLFVVRNTNFIMFWAILMIALYLRPGRDGGDRVLGAAVLASALLSLVNTFLLTSMFRSTSHLDRHLAIRDAVAQEYRVTDVLLATYSDYMYPGGLEAFVDEARDEMGATPFLIEIAGPSFPAQERLIETWSKESGWVLAGEVRTAFPHVPPSGLHVYTSPGSTLWGPREFVERHRASEGSR